MTDTILAVLAALGGVTAIAGAVVGGTFWLFKTMGSTWLDARFKERLEHYKHEQQKELEQVRFGISRLMDRATKLHQREFDVLPDVWAKVNDAVVQVQYVVSPFQQYPDLRRADTIKIDEIIRPYGFDQSQIEEIKSAADKNKVFHDMLDFKRAYEAREKAREFSVTYHRGAIFIQAHLATKFEVVELVIHQAVSERILNLDHPDILPRQHARIDAFLTTIDNLMKELEMSVKSRLWDD